nr:HNH endonuclease signature motif containing protein [Gordonia spumicola]
MPWSEGGDTSVRNGVLLCRMHHTLIHNGGWQVVLGDDGHPWFIEPGSTGPIRSHARRTLTGHADAAA